mgnify:CR=1 FL=1
MAVHPLPGSDGHWSQVDGPDTDEDLRRFAARADAEEAVRRFGQEAWLQLRPEDSCHLGGLLVDVAERSD